MLVIFNLIKHKFVKHYAPPNKTGAALGSALTFQPYLQRGSGDDWLNLTKPNAIPLVLISSWYANKIKMLNIRLYLRNITIFVSYADSSSWLEVSAIS